MIIFNATLRKAKKIVNKYYLDPEEYRFLESAIVNKSCLALFNDEKNYINATKDTLGMYVNLKDRTKLLDNKFFVFLIMQKYAHMMENTKLSNQNLNKIMLEYIILYNRKLAEEMYSFIMHMNSFFNSKEFEYFVTNGIFSNKPQDYYKTLYLLIYKDFETTSKRTMLEILLRLLSICYDTRESEELNSSEKEELCSNYLMLKGALEKKNEIRIQQIVVNNPEPCKIINFPLKKGN